MTKGVGEDAPARALALTHWQESPLRLSWHLPPEFHLIQLLNSKPCLDSLHSRSLQCALCMKCTPTVGDQIDVQESRAPPRSASSREERHLAALSLLRINGNCTLLNQNTGRGLSASVSSMLLSKRRHRSSMRFAMLRPSLLGSSLVLVKSRSLPPST